MHSWKGWRGLVKPTECSHLQNTRYSLAADPVLTLEGFSQALCMFVCFVLLRSSITTTRSTTQAVCILWIRWWGSMGNAISLHIATIQFEESKSINTHNSHHCVSKRKQRHLHSKDNPIVASRPFSTAKKSERLRR